METLIKLNNQTAGRDKLARLLQYTCRTFWHLIEQKERTSISVNKLKNLEYHLGTFRKLLRLGRFLDALYGALATIRHYDPTIRVSVTLSKISHSLFLLTDHVLWFGRVGLTQIDAKKWTNLSNKYWLYSITMNIIRDVYEIWRIMNTDLRLKSYLSINDYSFALQSAFYIALIKCLKNHKNIVVDTTKNICDFFIPLTALGHTKLSPGVIGLLGMVSSIAGMLSIIDPLLKLTPA